MLRSGNTLVSVGLVFSFSVSVGFARAASAADEQKRDAKPYSSFRDAPEVKAHQAKFQNRKAELRKKQCDQSSKEDPQHQAKQEAFLKQLKTGTVSVPPTVAAIDLVPVWEVACVGTCAALICTACVFECLGPEDFPCIIACCIAEDEFGVSLCVEACTD